MAAGRWGSVENLDVAGVVGSLISDIYGGLMSSNFKR